MAKVFDVTPEELEGSAGKMEGKCTEFNKAYQSIYTATAELMVKYKGQASETFNNRIEGYKNDFQAVEKALKNYAVFLREYAAKMKAAENEIKSKAGQLSVGQ